MTSAFHARNLRKGRISESGQICHVTTGTLDRVPAFADFACGRIAAAALMAERPHASTLCYVVMPDHLHWMVQLQGGMSLSACVRNVKSVSTHRLNKLRNVSGRLWQAGFHDHALRREEDIVATARYIVMNPVRAGLATRIGDYPLWDAIWLP